MYQDFRYRGPQGSQQLQPDPEGGFWLETGKQDPSDTEGVKRSRIRPWLGVIVTLYLIGTPLLRETGFTPPWVVRTALLIGMAALALRLLTFRRWADETPYAKPFFIAFGILIVELTIENAFIWFVSATDVHKYEHQEPLQDNVVLLYEGIARYVPAIQYVFLRPWAEIMQLLVALIMLGVSVLFDQVPFSGFGMMTRAIHTIWITRVIRTVSFMLTILPSQRPGCFERRFPPLPTTWFQFLLIGFTKLRAMGGCNDLVISGHAIIYVVAPLAYCSYYKGWTPYLLWLGVLHSSIRVSPAVLPASEFLTQAWATARSSPHICMSNMGAAQSFVNCKVQAPLTRQHYSVDMFLACIVTALVWHWCSWAYHGNMWRQRHPTEAADKRQWALTALILVVLAMLAYIVIAGGA